MIKVLSETKPKPKPEPKIKIKVNKKKLKKLRTDFDELRHNFSIKEIQEYRKAFYVAKNEKYLCESDIKKTNKNLTKLIKSFRFKKFRGNIDSIDYDTLIIMIIIMILEMMTNTEKLVVLEHYLKNLTEIITNQ